MMSSSKAVCARVLVVDDDPGMHTLVHDLVDRESTTVVSALTLEAGLKIAAVQRIDVLLLDHMLPDGQGIDRIADFIAQDRLLPILYVTGQSDPKTAIEAIKRGAFEYLSKPLDFELLRKRIIEAIEYRRLTRVPVLVDSTLSDEAERDILVGRCRGMQEVYKSIGRHSNTRTPIFIEGEVGTGKEKIARNIHQNGAFASSPFRKVSSREFEDSDLRVELFGGVAPSENKPSAILNCRGGTLMIDEIEHWSVATQSRLLRYLQSNEIDGVAADTRIILATTVKIQDLVHSGRLTSDLYYFLSPFVIRVPALRERQEDFELLVSHFMKRLTNVTAVEQTQGPPRVSSAALQLMKAYDWPGNIAELKSVLQGVLSESRGAVLASDALLRFLVLRRSMETTSEPTSSISGMAGNSIDKVQQNKHPFGKTWDLQAFFDQQIAIGTDQLYEQAVALLDEKLLSLVMKHTKGNRVKAAKLLGITRTSLRRKMIVSHQIEPATDSSDDLRR